MNRRVVTADLYLNGYGHYVCHMDVFEGGVYGWHTLIIFDDHSVAIWEF